MQKMARFYCAACRRFLGNISSVIGSESELRCPSCKSVVHLTVGRLVAVLQAKEPRGDSDTSQASTSAPCAIPTANLRDA